MTDQRARAEQHVEKRMNALLLYQELLTDSPPDAVTRIIASLADERRRADEEAKRLRECLGEVNRVLQDPESTGISDTIWYNDLITLVEFIEGCLDHNPDQQALPIDQDQARKEA